MTSDFKVQVLKTHYYGNHDDLKQFISYYYQIDIIRKLNPKSILEIGVGNGTVSNYLKQQGFNVSMCDFDKSLHPDYVADIRHLPFNNNSYDAVSAFEVLEHLPWQDAEVALKELARVSKKYVILSLPYSCISFEIIMKYPLLHKLPNQLLRLFFRIPLFFREIKFNGEHYWEIGSRHYPLGKIKRLLKNDFKIIKITTPLLNSYHIFFLLEKKDA